MGAYPVVMQMMHVCCMCVGNQEPQCNYNKVSIVTVLHVLGHAISSNFCNYHKFLPLTDSQAIM